MNRALLLALVAVSACTLTERRDTEKAIAEVLVSDDQEFQLGLQVHEQLKKENTKFLESPVVEGYVESLTQKLIAQTSKERKLEWRTYVIDDPNTINAFATPGGRIYVYTGLILAAENEAEIVGVMGHEMGHVVGRHSARQLVASYGLQAVTELALGKNADEIAKITSGLAGKTAQLAYGRDMELEADQYGARYASGAGYDPRGLATFFEKLKAKYGDTGPVMTFLSTHPANSDRINKVTELIAAEHLTGTDLGGPALKTAQQALGKK
jgi:predicted Zn-dependent protease